MSREARDLSSDQAQRQIASSDPIGLRLPQLWRLTTLGALCDENGGEIQTGPFGSQLHAADYVETGVPSVMPKDIRSSGISTDTIARVSESDANRLSVHRLRPGDIVYARRGDIGRRALVTHKEDGWLCGTGCLRIRLNAPEVAPEYLLAYLGHPCVQAWVESKAQGATMLNLNTSILRALPVRLPPLADQRRIADVLDKADAIRRKRKEAIALTEALLRSTFLEMFGDPVTNPKRWPVKPLGDFVDMETGHPFSSSQFQSHGIRLLRGANVLPQAIDWEDVRHWSAAEDVPARYHLRSSDVVLAMDRPWISYGLKVALISAQDLPAYLVQRVARLRAVNGLTNDYIYSALLHSAFLHHGAAHMTETTIPHLSPHDIRSYSIPIPDSATLKRFGQCVKGAHKIGRAAQAHLARGEALFASLVSQVFSSPMSS